MAAPFSQTISAAAKSPAVQREFARVRTEPIIQDRFDKATDARMIREHGIAGMMRLSRCVNEVVAFKANEWLIAYADQLDKRNKGRASIEGSVIDDLRKLYGKALVVGESIVEVVAEELRRRMASKMASRMALRKPDGTQSIWSSLFFRLWYSAGSMSRYSMLRQNGPLAKIITVDGKYQEDSMGSSSGFVLPSPPIGGPYFSINDF